MRCETCNLITRPDIAAAKGEKYCRCDPELDEIYDKFRGFLKHNDETIEKLANKLNKTKEED